MLTAIIVAAGSSRRVGFDKLLASIGGEPVLAHTLRAFERAPSVTEILLVVREDRRRQFEPIASPFKKVREIVFGGEHRQDSVQAGLRQLEATTRYVAVHDGARPLVRPEEIERVFEQARLHGAATLAEPVSDTLKRADKELAVTDSVNRNDLYAMQTPQIFERALLEEAYGKVVQAGQSVTDEVSAVESMGRKVVLVKSSDFNFKITFERDLRLAESVLQERGTNK
jgi:2-C-methyl-D-erythritol 4-phosphate cytidylyltransferase